MCQEVTRQESWKYLNNLYIVQNWCNLHTLSPIDNVDHIGKDMMTLRYQAIPTIVTIKASPCFAHVEHAQTY